jgi:GNAT superfamily N-acetyltransferase
MITKITYEEILPLWKKLWSDTKISPTSSIRYLGGYNGKYHLEEPHFFGWIEDDKIVGVNSCFKTDISYRSRGLYVEPFYRNRSIAQHLLLAVSMIAKINGAMYIWSMPRESALSVYERFGFERKTDFFNNTDYGPNCYVYKKL